MSYIKRKELFYKHSLSSDGLHAQCKKCFNNISLKKAYERKKILVNALGGKCQRCGYDKCIAALDFHHKDSNDKSFEIGRMMLRKSIDELLLEAQKCNLFCSNCHREEHYLTQEYLYNSIEEFR